MIDLFRRAFGADVGTGPARGAIPGGPQALGALAALLMLFGNPVAAAIPAPTLSGPGESVGSYTISWNGQAGSFEDTYTLQESSDVSPWTTVVNNGRVTSKDFTKTTSGARYYRVKHCFTSDAGGLGTRATTTCSAYSAVKTVQVYIQPTGTPAIGCTGCASPDTNGDLTITWTKPSGTITHYRVFSRRNGGAFQRTDVAGANTLSLAFNDLADGDWDFQVDACNTLLNTNCSANDSAIKSVDVLKRPSQPTNLQAPASSTTGNFTLSWSASTGTVDHYSLYRAERTGAACPTTGYGHIGNQSATSKAFSGHADGDFCFRVRACNSGSCSTDSTARSVSVLKVPTMPANVTLPATNESGDFTLSWDPSQETVAYYQVDRAKAGENCPGTDYQFCQVGQVSSPSMSFQDHEDGTYSFKVKACNASGCSARTTSVGIVVERSAAGLPDAEVVNLERPAGEYVGTLADKTDIDGGRVGYRVTIPVPPGRKGMGPAVSLNYNSGSGNGLAGMGWTLSVGQGSIYRCSHIEAIEGFTRHYNGSGSDRLCFNGQQLKVTDLSYGQVGSKYQTETQSFATFELVGAGSAYPESRFKVTDKSGVVSYYDEAVIPSRGDGTSSTYPTAWLLTRVEDLYGNRIDYVYAGGAEERLLSRVIYTGKDGQLGDRVVSFLYEDRPDRSTSFNHQGMKSIQSQRLKRVTTWIDAGFIDSGTMVTSTTLNYETSDASGRSLLKEMRLCKDVAETVCYPKTTFDYNDGTLSFSGRTARVLGEEFTLQSLGDIDGDGTADEMLLEEVVNTSGVRSLELVELRLSTRAQPYRGAFLSPQVHESLGYAPGYGYSRAKPRMTDFDADGQNDLVSIDSNGRLKVETWNRQNDRFEPIAVNLQLSTQYANVAAILDVDRDGDPDLVTTEQVGSDHASYIRFNCSAERSGELVFCGALRVPDAPAAGSDRLGLGVVGDIDGDLIADISFSGNLLNGDPVQPYVQFGKIVSGEFQFNAVAVPRSTLGAPEPLSSGGVDYSIDVNGDGRTDIFRRKDSGEILLWLNTGRHGGLMYQPVTVTGGISIDRNLANGMFVMDYNHDGRTDLMVPSAVAQNYCYLWRPDPSGEPLDICSEATLPQYRFENSDIPHLNRGVYDFDVVRFLQQANGSFALQRSSTPIEATIYASGECDANGDGLSDVCYSMHNQSAAVHSGPGGDDVVVGRYLGNQVGLGMFAQFGVRDQDSFGVDVMSRAVNGVGMTHRWSYGALSGSGHTSCPYGESAPFYRVDPELAMVGHFHFKSSMLVATRHEASNGVGGMNAECFRFENAMFSTGGRGFQGFRAITIDEDLDDGSDTSTRTEYYDYFPLTGKPMSVEKRLRSDLPIARPLTESIQDWGFVRHGNGVYVPYLTTKIDVTNNFDSAGREPMTSTTVANSRSAEDIRYGNVGVQTITTKTFDSDGTVLVFNATRTEHDYDYAPASAGWMDKLDRKVVTVSATGYSGLAGPRPNAEHNPDKVVAEDYTYYPGAKRQLKLKAVQSGIQYEEYLEEYEYDTYGNLTVVTAEAPDSPQGLLRVTRKSFEETQGYFPYLSTDAAGFQVLTRHSKAHGQMTETVRADGTTLNHDYDFAGQMAATRSTPGTKLDIVHQTCSGCGNAVVRRTTVMDGAPTTREFLDVLGRVIRTEVSGYGAGEFTVVTRSYDRRGRLLSESQPAPQGGAFLTRYEGYDALGRYSRKVVDRSGHAVSTQTWLYQNDGLKTTITLPGGELTAARRFDANGLLLSTTDADNSTTHHRYDGYGKLLLTQNAAGAQVRHYYDHRGRKIRVEDPDAGTTLTAAQTMQYDGFGDLIISENANGGRVVSYYDTLGRARVRRVNGELVGQWTYGTLGEAHQLLSVNTGDSDDDGETDYQKVMHYDGFGRIVRTDATIEGSPRTLVNRFAYDAYYDRLKGRTYPSNETVAYDYDRHGVLYSARSAWSGPDGADVELFLVEEMNARGQATRMLYGNGVVGVFNYVDSTGDLAEISYTADGSVPLARFIYRYNDAFGNLSVQENVVPGVLESFTYDNLQRLDTSTKVWSDGSAAPLVVDYDYDPVGNLVQKSDYGRVYHYGSVGRDAGGNAGPHAVRQVELTLGGVVEYQYDDAGNLVSGGGRAITYDVFNKPVRIQQGADVTNFRYAPDLELAARHESGSSTYYDDGYELVVSSGAILEERTFAAPQAVIESNAQGRALRFRHFDRMGSLVLVTDEEGGATERHGFDAFGRPLEGDWKDTGGLLHSGADGGQRLADKGFTGHDHLDRHKLVHMGGRIYDPLLGRFMSVDPYIQSQSSTQSQNAYSYVMNNPLSGVDPSGYQCDEVNRSGGGCSILDELQVNTTQEQDPPSSGAEGAGPQPSAPGPRTGSGAPDAPVNGECDNNGCAASHIASDGGETIFIAGHAPGNGNRDITGAWNWVWYAVQGERAAERHEAARQQAAEKQYDIILNTIRPMAEVGQVVAMIPGLLIAGEAMIPVIMENGTAVAAASRVGAGAAGGTATAAAAAVTKVVERSGGSIQRAIPMINSARLSQQQAVEVVSRIISSSGREFSVAKMADGAVLMLPKILQQEVVVRVTATGTATFERMSQNEMIRNAVNAAMAK